MADDYSYFTNKRPDRLYVSRSMEQKSYERDEDGGIREIVRPFRIVSKVIDSEEGHQFIKDGKEVSLRLTSGERQEIVAKFYEDSRGVFTLQIQKYTKESGIPHATHFTFIGSEITVLYNFLRNIALVPLKSRGTIKLDDSYVDELVLSREQALRILQDQPGILNEIVNHEISTEDIINLGYRRVQLYEFRNLLDSEEHFEARRKILGTNKRREDVWQDFFERNGWIFGYGLNYLLNCPLEGKRLEQVVSGSHFARGGKRVDALLKTKGLVSALAFGEIKTHKTPLLDPTSTPYRSESWSISKELVGGIAQVQRTVQLSLQNLRTKTEITDASGDLTGEQLFMYQPRAFLVAGSLAEFEHETGINEQKYSSFELFRRNLHTPEIITFDELYERASYIVESSAESVSGA